MNELRVRVRQIRHKAELDKKLREFIVKYERDPRTMASLEQQCRAVSAKMDRQEKLSNLEDTSKDLAARVEQYDADAKEQTILDRRENALLGQNRRFDIREGVIERAELEKEVKDKRKELDSVLRQLGEKRGLLDKMLGKSKGAAAP